eukprot:CAMPEP_0197521064 /NCGR_PEP_ID=MMETSP1318-20131121/6367_1 /TAXON_ID=552666 /ORGANISM="Partenskyella glossopodia, Strain RCC365" /LENGTH=409 /DNA_ID=CAMNT_0043072889 /DNA_START=159 /DNA_END=1388 /DNA_ORIENTATION=-
MDAFSCVLVFLLVAVPLYSVVVAQVPFAVDVVLTFDSSGQLWNMDKSLLSYESGGDDGGAIAHHMLEKKHAAGPGGERGGRDSPTVPSFDYKGKNSRLNGSLGDGSLGGGGSESKKSPHKPDQVTPGWSNDTIDIKLFRELEAKEFSLRIGPDYARNKKKAPSIESLYDFKGADIFVVQGAGAAVHVAKNMDFSAWVGSDGKASGWVDGAPRVIVSCLQFSVDNESAGWFAKDSSNKSKTYGIAFYFLLNKRGEEAMRKDTDPARLFKRFCRSELDILRFKSIIKIKDKDNLGLPFVLRKSMEQLDGKPFLAGKLKDNKSARFVGDCYLEFDSLTQNYSYFARKAISNFKSKLCQIRFHYGFCIEGQKNDEMPEQILGCVELGPGIDYNAAAEVNWRAFQPGDWRQAQM